MANDQLRFEMNMNIMDMAMDLLRLILGLSW